MREPAAAPFKVMVLNAISPNGLKRLPGDRYTVGKDLRDPDAVLVRSADMHSSTFRPACAPLRAPAPAPTTSPSSG